MILILLHPLFSPINDISYTDSIKLHHILSMSTGYVDQFIPTDPFTFFFDPNQWWALNSTETLLNMNHSTPGTFYYNNSACHLNAHALYYGSGMTPSEFADSYLFPHLGIYNPTWEAGYLEINDGSAMLHLTLREMVKLGQLYFKMDFQETIKFYPLNGLREQQHPRYQQALMMNMVR